jgi:hypothetical protein
VRLPTIGISNQRHKFALGIGVKPSINAMLSATSAEPNIYRTEMIFSQPNAQQAPPQPAAGNDSAHSMTVRRFPPPWTAEETDGAQTVRTKIHQWPL